MIARVTLGSHMDAALRESFLDHGRNVHEWLDHAPGDAFRDQPAQLLLLAGKLAGCKRGQRADSAEPSLGTTIRAVPVPVPGSCAFCRQPALMES